MGLREQALYSVKNGTSLSKYPDFINDKEVVLAAVNKDTYNILHASPELQMDEEVALAVVNKDGFALKLLPNFKNNKKVVLAALHP